MRKGGIETTKNYLEYDEIEELNRLVTQFLQYAERKLAAGKLSILTNRESNPTGITRQSGTSQGVGIAKPGAMMIEPG